VILNGKSKETINAVSTAHEQMRKIQEKRNAASQVQAVFHGME